MNVKEIKTLVGIMEDSSLTALEIEVPDPVSYTHLDVYKRQTLRNP